MRLRPVLIGVTLALAILIMAIAQASGARQQTSIGKASLQVVTKMPSSPQQDTVRLAQAIASPSLSIPKRVSLASGGVTLDPVDASVSPKVSREQVTTQFKRSALLGPQTATAAPDVRLVRLTRPHSSWKDRLVWAVIMLAVPTSLAALAQLRIQETTPRDRAPDRALQQLTLSPFMILTAANFSWRCSSLHDWSDARCTAEAQVMALRACHPDSENSNK